MYNYKTKLCRSVTHDYVCRWGDNCTFAHSIEECRPLPKWIPSIWNDFPSEREQQLAEVTAELEKAREAAQERDMYIAKLEQKVTAYIKRDQELQHFLQSLHYV